MALRWGYKLEVFVLAAVGLSGLLFLLKANEDEFLQTGNASVANISGFADLPGHIQDFLRYKHCRAFPQLLDVSDKCGGPDGSPEVFLLLAIKSSPINYERREVIRKTWGEERYKHCRAFPQLLDVSDKCGGPDGSPEVFLLLAIKSSPINYERREVIRKTWGEERDYHGLRVRRLFLVGEAGDRRELIAHVGPVREKWSKYYVPKQVAASDAYPPYCGGGGILMSGFTARVIHRESQAIELLPIDDVYLGMCLEQAGRIRTVGVRVPSAKLESFDPCYYNELLLVHRFVPYETLLMWHAIHEPDLHCGKRLQVYDHV
nr:N-acetyllactosaminide beta-1,3-N-acetylglucosaminyltransferase 3 [Pelodiscus sinensis]|eukprot:XP_025045056.1 N-acetyllactosaminide beta-1,3-N-acetylglucosaminyltransferase 3 [Pelodiscus sinensis]